jgi:hypothetical protein
MILAVGVPSHLAFLSLLLFASYHDIICKPLPGKHPGSDALIECKNKDKC